MHSHFGMRSFSLVELVKRKMYENVRLKGILRQKIMLTLLIPGFLVDGITGGGVKIARGPKLPPKKGNNASIITKLSKYIL